MSYKLLVKDSRGERELLLVGAIVVGRDPRCDVSAADPLLSRRHAEFIASDQCVVVRDLESRNGILVNGKKQTEAVLQPGDVVRVAHLVITFLSSTDSSAVSTGRAAETQPDTEPGPLTYPAAASDRSAANRDRTASGPAPQAAESMSGRTALMSPAAMAADAAASSRGSPVAAPSSRSAPATRSSGSWAVKVAQDDRTNMVAPPSSARPGDEAVAAARAGPDSNAGGGAAPDRLSQVIDAGLAPPASARHAATEPHMAAVPAPTVTEPAPVAARLPITGPAGAEMVVAQPAPAGLPVGERRTTPLPWQFRVALWLVAVAIGSFVFGVASTMVWLHPALPVLTFAESTTGLAAIAVAMVFALCLAGLVLWRLRRGTLSALAAFSADIRALAAGQPGAVADPLGAAETRELAQTVNGLMGRR